MNVDELCINTIRMLSVDMVEEANSGHPGMPMGAAPMAYVLWTRFLKHNTGELGRELGRSLEGTLPILFFSFNRTVPFSVSFPFHPVDS